MLHQFDTHTFSTNLNTGWLGRHFWYFDQLESTNSYLAAKQPRHTPHGLVCLCDEQTLGKGQYGKGWQSKPGANLTFTAVFKPVGNTCLKTLGLACAYSVAELVTGCVSVPVYLRYPNDIYAGSHKIGGILTEASFSGNKVERILTGIGINVEHQDMPEELKNTASSIGNIANGYPIPAREILLAQLLTRIENNYQHWEARETRFLRQMNRSLYGYGEWVHLREGEDVMSSTYKLLGVNEEGGLCVLDEDFNIKVFTHEQVRVHEFAADH